MSTNRFVTLVNGVQRLVTAIAASAGVADANKIIATGSDGRIDSTLMPVGVGVQTQAITASENLAAGDFVNIFSDSGTPSCRKADASNGRIANGFVLSAVPSGQQATVYFSGFNTSQINLTPGTQMFLSASTAGTATATAPNAPALVQVLGIAVSETVLTFEFNPPTEQTL